MVTSLPRGMEREQAGTRHLGTIFSGSSLLCVSSSGQLGSKVSFLLCSVSLTRGTSSFWLMVRVEKSTT